MKNKIKKAFSLIEVIWGVLILSIIIVTVTGIFTTILVSTKKSEKLVVATNLAQKQLEYIKLMGFSDVEPAIGSTFDGRNSVVTRTGSTSVYFPPYPAGKTSPLRETVDSARYYYVVTVTDKSGGNKNLVSITVSVYWDQSDADNAGKNFVTLELYKAK